MLKGSFMTETDLKLLMSAAAAAEVKIDRWHGDGGDIWEGVEKVLGGNEFGTYIRWNPLRDDGDALRLAACLRISIEFDDNDVSARFGPGGLVYEMSGADIHVATRRSIVRAAAGIFHKRHPYMNTTCAMPEVCPEHCQEHYEKVIDKHNIDAIAKMQVTLRLAKKALQMSESHMFKLTTSLGKDDLSVIRDAIASIQALERDTRPSRMDRSLQIPA